MKSTRRLTSTIEQASQIIKGSNRVALFAHTNPDGDTIGACISLKLALCKFGKKQRYFATVASMNDCNLLAKVFKSVLRLAENMICLLLWIAEMFSV